MARASALFSEADKQAVHQAVTEAEGRTSGEIVPVVATRSGRYDRAEDIVGLLFALVALVVVWLVFQRVEPADEAWEVGPTIAVGLPLLLATIIAGFAVGAILATWFPLLARPFVWPPEIDEEVQRSARLAFFDFRVRRTAGTTGILIYVSLYERRVRVIGDDALTEKVDEARWQEVADLIVAGIRRGAPAEGLCAGIAQCGEILAEQFPIAADDVNELTNDLRLID